MLLEWIDFADGETDTEDATCQRWSASQKSENIPNNYSICIYRWALDGALKRQFQENIGQK